MPVHAWIKIAEAVGIAAVNGGWVGFLVRWQHRRYISRTHFCTPFVLPEEDEAGPGAHRRE